ncbi:hypothetical protein [Xanthocytophaga agilis]|uniref:Lipoprotein n=1 Tax=Xanthocytophaga agilis TaxID=3048010 RepID=A0AAE3R239_9BACT|nr:hypothetical protein [Xanthocytophaga agilis]MDJ1499478.1 hypothetical protein [Xanthocytophaga agilis]
MVKVIRVFIPLLMVFVMSCVNQDIEPTEKETSLKAASLITPVEQDPTEKPCYTSNVEWVYEGEQTIALMMHIVYEQVECPTSGNTGSVGSSTCELHFPDNPINGQKYVAPSTSCRAGSYYYSCQGNTWVIPADYLYGTPPTNPTAGMRYIYNYTNQPGSITFIYLASTGSSNLPDGWYVDILPVASTACGTTSCKKCGQYLATIAKGGYYFKFYGAINTSGVVSKVTVQQSLSSTPTTVTNASVTYTLVDVDSIYQFVGTAQAPDGTIVYFNDIAGV